MAETPRDLRFNMEMSQASLDLASAKMNLAASQATLSVFTTLVNSLINMCAALRENCEKTQAVVDQLEKQLNQGDDPEAPVGAKL